MLRYSLAAASIVVIGGLAWFFTQSGKSSRAFVFGMQHPVDQEKRFLIYEVDHAVLAQTLREFASKQGWTETGFDKEDPRVPAALRILKPRAIFIYPDYIALDFGDAFRAMDIRAFKPGVEGSGTKKLADGLWVYLQEGTYPRDP